MGLPKRMPIRNRFGLFDTSGEAAMASRRALKPVAGQLSEATAIAGAALGDAALGPLGGIAGHAVGKTTGNWLTDQAIPWIAANTWGQITGKGDYTVRNSLPKSKMPYGRTAGTTVIQHRSYVADVNSVAGTFNIASYQINPGDSRTFPWLAPIASNFEEYTIDGMVFEYKSSSGDSYGGSSTALGTVIMATEYNIANRVFPNKSEMENHFFAQSAKPSINQLHAIEAKNSTMPLDVLFVRSSGVPNGYDARFYDLGRFSIAVDGTPVSQKVGELWVTYQITLRKPRISDAFGLQSAFIPRINNTGTLLHFGTLPSVNVLAAGNIVTPIVDANTIQFANLVRGGVYMFNWTCRIDGGPTITSLPTLGFTNATLQPLFLEKTASSYISVDQTLLIGTISYCFVADDEVVTASVVTDGTVSGSSSKVITILLSKFSPSILN